MADAIVLTAQLERCVSFLYRPAAEIVHISSSRLCDMTTGAQNTCVCVCGLTDGPNGASQTNDHTEKTFFLFYFCF